MAASAMRDQSFDRLLLDRCDSVLDEILVQEYLHVSGGEVRDVLTQVIQ
jgi:hypothetical protein